MSRVLVYVAHPVSGDVAGNLALGREYVRAAYRAGYAPLAPWITGCEVLDEGDPADRAIGLECDFATVVVCAEIWLCGPRVSAGMQGEFEVAGARGIPYRRFLSPADIGASPW